MVRKKLDARVRTLIERSVVTGQRSMLVLVGDHGKDQVPNLHQLLVGRGDLAGALRPVGLIDARWVRGDQALEG